MICIMINFPLVSGKIKVTEEMLSEYQLQITDDNDFSFGKNKIVLELSLKVRVTVKKIS